MISPDCEHKNGRYDSIETRLSLLSRLKNRSDNESWKVFFDTYWRLIHNTAMRAGLNDAEAQDVVQETVISVLKAIPNFAYDAEKGSFKKWLYRLTGRRIIDHMRKKSRGPRLLEPKRVLRRDGHTSTDTSTTNRIPDTDQFKAIWDGEWEANLQDVVLDRLKAKVNLKQYQIFDLCVIQGWPVSEVARALNVSRARIYLTKHRVQKRFRRELEDLIANPLP